MQTPENILVEKLIKGDKTAFEALFKMYYSFLCAYANKIINDVDDSEEIVQETFFQIWQKRDNIDIQTSFKSYLFRSVHNSCLNFIKHKNIKQKHIDYSLYEQANSSLDFSDALDASELQTQIRIAIDKLPTERKKIFLLIRFDSLKYAEVAEKLSISIKTVENQMGSALKFLRNELKDYLPTIIIVAINFLKIFYNWIGENI
ncbi:MAG: RNA polymerase sigma-70 factor [Bacteroidota bacterium]